MSVKVIQGLVSSVQREPLKAPVKNPNNQASVPQQNPALSQSVGRAVATEAAITAVRTSKAPGSPSKVRDFKDAKELSQEIAEKIRGEDGLGKEAHGGLSTVDAREHFSS